MQFTIQDKKITIPNEQKIFFINSEGKSEFKYIDIYSNALNM
ncbi:hypothetical protein UT300018_25480 [Clostridium faecium]